MVLGFVLGWAGIGLGKLEYLLCCLCWICIMKGVLRPNIKYLVCYLLNGYFALSILHCSLPMFLFIEERWVMSHLPRALSKSGMRFMWSNYLDSNSSVLFFFLVIEPCWFCPKPCSFLNVEVDFFPPVCLSICQLHRQFFPPITSPRPVHSLLPCSWFVYINTNPVDDWMISTATWGVICRSISRECCACLITYVAYKNRKANKISTNNFAIQMPRSSHAPS